MKYLTYQLPINKIILLILLATLLVSCTQYRYEIEYEKCNRETGSLTYTGMYKPVIRDTSDSVSQLTYYGDEKNPPIVNVCGITYTETELTN